MDPPFSNNQMKISPKTFKFTPFLLSIIVLAFAGCKGGSGGPANGLSTENKVVWHILGDIERMNPYLSTDADAGYVQGLIWENLTSQNPRTLAWIPSLAELPEESPDHL